MTYRSFFVVVALLALTAFVPQPMPQRPLMVQLQDSANGTVWLSLSSVGRPFTFDSKALHFAWQAYDALGNATATLTPADVRVGAWESVNTYPPYVDTSPGRRIVRLYRARVDFGAPPPHPGLYGFKVLAFGNFANTDTGQALEFRDSVVTSVYWPDERNDDTSVRDLRHRILGRTVYAFGGSIVGCYGAGRSYPPAAPLRVTSVERRRNVAYSLYTGTTVHGANGGDYFIAIDPIEVKIATDAPPSSTMGSSGAETPCDPGFRFADPWQAGVTITSATPPPALSDRTKIVPGMTRHRVLWLLGYPDAYGTAAYFNDLERWDYVMPSPFSSWVTFKNDRVVHYEPPGELP